MHPSPLGPFFYFHAFFAGNWRNNRLGLGNPGSATVLLLSGNQLNKGGIKLKLFKCSLSLFAVLEDF